MRPTLLFLVLAMSLMAGGASADMTFTVTKDSTMDGVDGSLMQVTEPGFPGETYFLGIDGDFVRAYAVRDDSDGSWFTPFDPILLVPATTITAGQTWTFLPMEGFFLTQAEAIGVESVGVGAGTFACWRIEVTPVGQPGNVVAVFWFADGVGLVAQDELEGGKAVWRIALENYSVSGSGYFPLTVGNTWDYSGVEVPNAATSFGDLKGRFTQ